MTSITWVSHCDVYIEDRVLFDAQRSSGETSTSLPRAMLRDSSICQYEHTLIQKLITASVTPIQLETTDLIVNMRAYVTGRCDICAGELNMENFFNKRHIKPKENLNNRSFRKGWQTTKQTIFFSNLPVNILIGIALVCLLPISVPFVLIMWLINSMAQSSQLTKTHTTQLAALM
jgi:hypothetical protein